MNRNLEWLISCNFPHPEKVKDVRWIPKETTGKYALPADYVVPLTQNPLAPYQRKAKRGKRTAKMEQETHEYRWLYRAYKTEEMNDTDEFERMMELQKKLVLRGHCFHEDVWPKGWRDSFLEAIEKGMALTAACGLLGLPRHRVAKFVKTMDKFGRDYRAAKNQRQRNLLDNITDIALRGNSETNKMKATMFLLERQFPEGFSPRQELTVTKPTAPMDILLGTVTKEDGDE